MSKNKTYKEHPYQKQHKICEQFLKLYPDHSLMKIHECFSEINPAVTFNHETMEFDIWVANKNTFEELLNKK